MQVRATYTKLSVQDFIAGSEDVKILKETFLTAKKLIDKIDDKEARQACKEMSQKFDGFFEGLNQIQTYEEFLKLIPANPQQEISVTSFFSSVTMFMKFPSELQKTMITTMPIVNKVASQIYHRTSQGEEKFLVKFLAQSSTYKAIKNFCKSQNRNDVVIKTNYEITSVEIKKIKTFSELLPLTEKLDFTYYKPTTSSGLASLFRTNPNDQFEIFKQEIIKTMLELGYQLGDAKVLDKTRTCELG